MGWIGVDLFFVLSGFLVSGLLFNEIKNTGKVNPKLFLIRRGFKIYPAFYFFFFSTLAIRYLINDLMFPLPKILSEIFFLQSYLDNIWLHTWSLAIEEHFYIFIAILLWVLYKKGLILKKRIMISILLSIWVVLVGLRFGYCCLELVWFLVLGSWFLELTQWLNRTRLRPPCDERTVKVGIALGD